MRRLVPVLLALAVVSPGCAFLADDPSLAGSSTPSPDGPGRSTAPGPGATPGADTGSPTRDAPAAGTPSSAASEPTSTATPIPSGGPPDPAEDVLGWERGYWHDESVDATASDGLNDAEFAAVKARAMARVEVVRGLEFRSDVAFEFTTRAALEFPSPEPDAFRDAYWEAAFVVGEDRRAADASAELYDVVVDGAAYGGDRVVMVVEDPSSPELDAAVLAHELVHAVEAQNDVYADGPRPYTGDAAQAHGATVEGSAMFYERQYTSRCGAEWACIDAGTATPPPDADRVNEGLYVDFSLRYAMGERFVEAMAERDGDALERMRRDPPASTEQVVHPGLYPDEEPDRVRVEDRSGGDWERVSQTDDQVGDTLGEARLYTMLWYNDVVDPERDVAVTVDQRVPLDYSHPATEGWAGDRVVVYANDSARGYVFASTWDAPRDARQFRDAYVELLRSHGAREVRDGVYVIEGGPFADAFRVTLDGDGLVVVNAPTADALDGVHAPAG